MVSPFPSAAGGRARTGEVVFLLQDIAWLRLRLVFGGKTSSRFIFLLLFVNVPGIGASRRQEMPRFEGRASSTGISRNAFGLGTRCLSRCHRHRGVRERTFIQSPSSSPQRLGSDAAARARLAASRGREPGRGRERPRNPGAPDHGSAGKPSSSLQHPPAVAFSWGTPMRSSLLPISGRDRLCRRGLRPSVLSVR